MTGLPQPPLLVAIAGPTGVGKTGVAVELAGLLKQRGEDPVAVNCDSMQVYEGLAILSGAPGPMERAELEHRLTGFVPVDEQFSAGRYARRAREEIDSLLAEGRRPLSYEDSIAGDCMVCNAWSANATHVHRWMFREANNVWAGKRLVFFRRFYPDGRVRPARINVAKSWEGKSREGEPGR